ncbi:HTH domain-containing protein [Bifidobacterium eulemuris]|uniref:Uncharacterized protein n=1 Tax=Bifidobacterium eulemuris TaxID=1765219 RepID=A0A261GEY6_9BIFI|nr:HTH domain-containing protein [Bifidobacterium eulemuris]OZG69605.1 hypothetical protein BEUL_0022 [Bifidobacterium eulemuris]QOL32278.1 hypothetical protein BE0216_07280 [Bifidobacterium eulemuris]
MARVPFSREERAYLITLPAVVDVSEYRIQYSTRFRNEFLRRYRNGESAVRLFREAGLDPKIIGRKRIERCTNRWMALPIEELGDDDQNDDGQGSGVSLAPRESDESNLALTRSLTLMQSRRITELEIRIASLERKLARLAGDELDDDSDAESAPASEESSTPVSVAATRAGRIRQFSHSMGRR